MYAQCEEERIFRPACWNAFGMDKEAQDYRACQAYGQCTDRMDGMDRDQIRNAIEQGNTALGIEFGSTRIKAVLVDGKNKPIAQGSYDWENRFEEGI